MKEQQVDIQGKKYELSYNLRAVIIFERIAGKPFEVDGVSDWSMLIYACMLSADKDLQLSFDEFIDAVNQAEISKQIGWLAQIMTVNNQMSEGETSKKKSRGVKSIG